MQFDSEICSDCENPLRTYEKCKHEFEEDVLDRGAKFIGDLNRSCAYKLCDLLDKEGFNYELEQEQCNNLEHYCITKIRKI